MSSAGSAITLHSNATRHYGSASTGSRTVFGYAQSVAGDAVPRGQTSQLEQAGCRRIWIERIGESGTTAPGLVELLDCVRPGDTLVLWRLCHLGSTAARREVLMSRLARRGVEIDVVEPCPADCRCRLAPL